MNLNDISNKITSKVLNKNLYDMFKEQIDLENFTLEQLENARNKIRTDMSQIETNESFDSVNNEDYHKKKLYLDIINTEIQERSKIEEKAVSKSQQRAAGIALAAKRGDMPKSKLRGASKEMMKMSTKELEKYAGTKHKGLPKKKTSESVVSERSTGVRLREEPQVRVQPTPQQAQQRTGMGAKLVGNKLGAKGSAGMMGKALDKLSQGSALPANLAKQIAPFSKSLETILADPQLRNKFITLIRQAQSAGNMQPAGGQEEKPTGQAAGIDFKKLRANESFIFETEEDKAEIVIAAKDMIERLTSWMQDTAEMESESMLGLADSIRNEMGDQTSNQFTEIVKPSLETLYSAMEETRKSLVSGLGLLTGETEPEEMLGADDESDELDTDMGDEDQLDLGLEDDFGAASPARGGRESAGREKRESARNDKRALVERSRWLGNVLSSKKK